MLAGARGVADRTQEPPFVYCLGDSHVRPMSSDPGFLPLFVGAGRQVCFITDRHATLARNRIIRNFRRLEPARPVLLAFGEPDIRFYLEDRFEARSLGGPDAEAFVERCAERYLSTIGDLRRRFENLILVCNVVPRRSAEYNRLAIEYNRLLRIRLPALGIDIVEFWDDIVETRDGPVRARFSADPVHLNHNVAPIIRGILERKGLTLGPRPAAPFAWSYFYRIDFEGDDNTRIWGDARLNSGSSEFAASQIAREAAARVAGEVAADPDTTVLVSNCREGLVPLSLPGGWAGHITAIDPSRERIALSKRLIRFAGRDDIEPLCGDLEGIPPHDIVMDFCVLSESSSGRSRALHRLAEKSGKVLCLLGRGPDPTDRLRTLGFRDTARITVEVKTKSGNHGDCLWIARRGAGGAPRFGGR